jgi:hypothetical protein
VIPLALGIVLISAVLLAGAAIGALTVVVIYGRNGAGCVRLNRDRRSSSPGVISGISLVASGAILTAEASTQGAGPELKARTQLRLPR